MTTVDDFIRDYYRARLDWQTTWMGYPSVKTPTDLWVIQEILTQTKPGLVIECGTFAGGSALFYGHVLDANRREKTARVLTIDTTPPNPVGSVVEGFPFPPNHPRVVFLRGSTVNPKTVEEIQKGYGAGSLGTRTMVLLDSQHEAKHVRRELELWAPLVSPGCYLVVEDTIINGNPVTLEDTGDDGLRTQLEGITKDGGPGEALEDWLTTQPEGRWTVDVSREKFMLTYNRGGYLLRNPEPNSRTEERD